MHKTAGHCCNLLLTMQGNAARASLKSNIVSNQGFQAYSDASWHKPDELGYNSFGYVLFLFGGPISYASKKLKIVALS